MPFYSTARHHFTCIYCQGMTSVRIRSVTFTLTDMPTGKLYACGCAIHSYKILLFQQHHIQQYWYHVYHHMLIIVALLAKSSPARYTICCAEDGDQSEPNTSQSLSIRWPYSRTWYSVMFSKSGVHLPWSFYGLPSIDGFPTPYMRIF